MLPTSAIYKELRRREKQVEKVQRKRDRLAAKIESLDDMIRGMGRRG